MTYFEGVLYVLHDNARVVRGWDVKSGTMTSEWTLPRVEGGFDKQWEGISLQRVPARQGTSSVTLYLALETPAQIWSFQLQEDETMEKKFVLPECAAAV